MNVAGSAQAQPVKVAEIDDVEPGSTMLIEAAVAGTEDDIALIRDEDGTYYALDDTCSHEVASLSDGWVEEGAIECPMHASQFNLKTGWPMCLPATKPVRTHAVEIRDAEVWLVPSLGSPAS